MKTILSGVLLLLSLLLLPAHGCAAENARVGWMIYPYLLSMPEDQYQRLLQSKDVEYVGIQVTAKSAYSDDQTKARVRELARAGKKIVLQLWYGAGRPFSWERYNFPNIALDPRIREEFFSKVTDPLIDFLGANNLYAVHLLEETGMQYGWDVDMPGRPDRDDDGYENGSNWDNPPSFTMERCISGPNVLTIRKYQEVCRAQTGLDMRLSPIWTPEQQEGFRTWVQQTMEAGAHNEFAKHVHKKYPGLRVYAFNMGPALGPQSRVLDGQFIDPYTSTVGVYLCLRGFRAVMRPDEELVGMVWGNREEPIPQRLPQQAACYLGGCSVLSTFGDNEYRDPQWFSTVRDSVNPFLGLPVFRSQPKVLLLERNPFAASLRHAQYWITGFAQYDVCEDWAEDQISLDNYEMVFSYAGWHKGLPDWVRRGGVLVTVHPASNLLVTEGLLEAGGNPKRETIDYRPDPWMREHLGLRESYPLQLDHRIDYPVKNTAAIHQDQFLYVIPYGKGLIVLISAICDVQAPWVYAPHWEPYRQLLTDVCRGTLIYQGKAQLADTCFDDPKLGNDYLKATSADGRYTVYLLLNDVHGSA
ncbi:MAG TPA: hypothetical protein VGM23_00220, partial [Armatimonadota bacterium]